MLLLLDDATMLLILQHKYWCRTVRSRQLLTAVADRCCWFEFGLPKIDAAKIMRGPSSRPWPTVIAVRDSLISKDIGLKHALESKERNPGSSAEP